jgi:hypothetical protein
MGDVLRKLAGDGSGVDDAIVPSRPALDVGLDVDALGLCERVAGMFFAATAMAGLCGEAMAITKGTPVLDEPLIWRSVRGDVG